VTDTLLLIIAEHVAKLPPHTFRQMATLRRESLVEMLRNVPQIGGVFYEISSR
jgi:hypothetical protein